MYRFHTTIHRAPAIAPPGAPLRLRGEHLGPLAVTPTELALPFEVTFEAVEAELSELERLYCEPDGSFVWVAGEGEPHWQLDGQLYDRHDRLLYVDLKGTCPAARLDELLGVLGWPNVPVAFQLVQEAVLLGETDFRRYAGA